MKALNSDLCLLVKKKARLGEGRGRGDGARCLICSYGGKVSYNSYYVIRKVAGERQRGRRERPLRDGAGTEARHRSSQKHGGVVQDEP
jgi:hypothetical protein